MPSKQVNSRNRKALSNILLIYFFLKEKGTVYFLRSKLCSYALKVICGHSMEINGNSFDYDSFGQISKTVLSVMQYKMNEIKHCDTSMITVSKSDLEKCSNIVVDIEDEEHYNYRKREKEFSNALAGLLLEQGYQLLYEAKSQRKVFANKYFAWDGLITPDGKEYRVKRNEKRLISLINRIQRHFNEYCDFELSFEDISDIYLSKIDDIFIPVDYDKFSISSVNKIRF